MLGTEEAAEQKIGEANVLWTADYPLKPQNFYIKILKPTPKIQIIIIIMKIIQFSTPILV